MPSYVFEFNDGEEPWQVEVESRNDVDVDDHWIFVKHADTVTVFPSLRVRRMTYSAEAS